MLFVKASMLSTRLILRGFGLRCGHQELDLAGYGCGAIERQNETADLRFVKRKQIYRHLDHFFQVFGTQLLLSLAETELAVLDTLFLCR